VYRFDHGANARKLAGLLVERRLATCVNMLPGACSLYRWKNTIEEATETILIIKTSRHLAEEVHGLLRSAHSYELPEFVVLPLASGGAEYLDWLRQGMDVAAD